jgi:tubulin alpha
MVTNLTPYHFCHYVVGSYAPILNKEMQYLKSISTVEMTEAVINPDLFTVSCDPTKGQYTACGLLYRGDVISKEIQDSVQAAKKTVQFADWSSGGFKCNISEQIPSVIGELATHNKSVTCLSNTTSVTQVFRRLRKDFDAMYNFRAFVHWFVGTLRDIKKVM